LNRRLWIIVVVVLVAGGVGTWLLTSRGRNEAPKYRTAAVERGDIEQLVSATGTVRPVEQVEVGSQVSGTVAKLNTDYNARVTAGQILCQLEPSSFRARAVQSEAQVARAEASLKDARRVLARAHELSEKDYISKAEVEGAEIAVDQRLAELKQARAQLEAARVDLANTTIRAPIDGVVIARSVDLGQTVAASLQAPKLFVIANDLSQMQVETRIDEADIGLIHPGLTVRFTVDAFPDNTFEGRVSQVRLEPVVEQGVVTYTTVIRTENPELKLRPGMTANVSVQVAKRENAMKVPNSALRFHPPMEMGRGRGKGGPAGGAPSASASGGMGAGASSPKGFGGNPSAAGMTRGSGGSGAAIAGEAGARGGDRMTMGSKPDSAGHGAWAGRGGAGEGGGGRGGAWSRGASAGEGRHAPGIAESEIGARPEGEFPLKPGAVYVLRDGKPVRVSIMTGISDGAATEVKSEQLALGDPVIVGLEVSMRGGNLQPPPGMGGPFGGPRPGGGGGGGGGGRR
jgi:HlyD family secretion protein